MARLQMVMYQLPSSVTVIPNDKEDVEKEGLRKAVESLDNTLYGKKDCWNRGGEGSRTSFQCIVNDD